MSDHDSLAEAKAILKELETETIERLEAPEAPFCVTCNARLGR